MANCLAAYADAFVCIHMCVCVRVFVSFAICNWRNFRFHAHNSHCVLRLQSTASLRLQPTDFNAAATKREQREGERGCGGVRSCAALKHAAIAARTWRLFIMRINILASVAGCVDSPATPAFALSSRDELCVRCMPGPSPSCPLCVCLPDAACQLPLPDNDIGFSLILI